jgi:peroxiredoxin Q/BCP
LSRTFELQKLGFEFANFAAEPHITSARLALSLTRKQQGAATVPIGIPSETSGTHATLANAVEQLANETGDASLRLPEPAPSFRFAVKLSHTLFLMSISSLFFGAAQAEPLSLGNKAPAVSATTDEGQTLNLADVYANNDYTLVWFYPRALTGGCTKQGCSLRDASSDLKAHGVAVVGVSNDPVEKQRAFKDTNHFPFPLLADVDQIVIKAFGQAGGSAAAREAYLINRSGEVVYHDEKQTEQQAEKVLAFLKAKKS